MNRVLAFRFLSTLAVVLCCVASVSAETGDPQIRTDHPWYPGELAISNFERLFETQADTYRRVTGISVETEEDKSLASWLWRNTHYWHAEAGRRDLWGKGFTSPQDSRLREYWSGLFAYGFGLCGTTHSQWTAEFEHLLGHGRGRGVGAAGHNAFEALVRGGPYGNEGKWVLLDHDLSSVVFDESGQRLLGLGEMQTNVDQWIDRKYKPSRQRGWLVCGLHPGDGESYRRYAVAEYLAGYAGPPPMVHLRRGETMRRYFDPGLDDGKTFVFWGRNYDPDSIPGPQRTRTWVNQPDKMFGSTSGTPHIEGQARYANVQYIYRPDFRNGDYREGVIRESSDEVIFEFQTPYIIGATPPNRDAWGIYEQGCRNGLIVRGEVDCFVEVSTDRGASWHGKTKLSSETDLTDHVKGRSQYWIRFSADATQLAPSNLEIQTVCQANVAVLPRLKDGGTSIRYDASGQRTRSLGPEMDLSRSALVDGDFGESSVTMKLEPQNPVTAIFAAAHMASGSPPDPNVTYEIDYQIGKQTGWEPIVNGWTIPREGSEPKDFWSQSFCYGKAELKPTTTEPILIRFKNDHRKRILRAEVHCVEQLPDNDPVRVTYHWTDDQGTHTKSHVFDHDATWNLETGKDVVTHWVEVKPVSSDD